MKRWISVAILQPKKVNHLQRWSWIFRSEETEIRIFPHPGMFCAGLHDALPMVLVWLRRSSSGICSGQISFQGRYFQDFLTAMKFHRHFQMVTSFGGHNLRSFTVINTTLMSFFSVVLLFSLCWRAYRQVLCCLLLDSVFRNNWEQWVSLFMISPLRPLKGRTSACQSTKGKWCWLKM